MARLQSEDPVSTTTMSSTMPARLRRQPSRNFSSLRTIRAAEIRYPTPVAASQAGADIRCRRCRRGLAAEASIGMALDLDPRRAASQVLRRLALTDRQSPRKRWVGTGRRDCNTVMGTPGGKRVVYITPVMPQPSGNGLAMRAASILEALARRFEVDLFVVPVAGAA